MGSFARGIHRPGNGEPQIARGVGITDGWPAQMIPDGLATLEHEDAASVVQATPTATVGVVIT